jgi:hypothetical protein
VRLAAPPSCARCHTPKPQLGHEEPRFCGNCGWPLLQPCPYEAAGCRAELQVVQESESPSKCPSCFRPLEQGKWGRSVIVGAPETIRRRYLDWGTRFGPGMSRSVRIPRAVTVLEPSGPVLEYALFNLEIVTVLRSAGRLLVAGNAGKQGQFHCFTPKDSDWGFDPPYTFSFLIEEAAAAGWHAWIRGGGGVIHLDMLERKQSQLPASADQILCVDATGRALIVQGATLHWCDHSQTVCNQTLPSYAGVAGAVQTEEVTTVILRDGTIFEGPAGELRQVSEGRLANVRGVCAIDGRLYLWTASGASGDVREMETVAGVYRETHKIIYEGAYEPAIFPPTANGPMVVGASIGAGAAIVWRNYAQEDKYQLNPGHHVEDLIAIEGVNPQGRPQRLTSWVQNAGYQFELRTRGGTDASIPAIPLGARPKFVRMIGTEEGFIVATYDAPHLVARSYKAIAR